MRIAAAVSATLLLAAGTARADDVSELRERLEAQEQKIRVLERKLELQDEATKAAVPTTPVVRASPQQGFRIQSADGANVVRLRGVLQFDGRYFPDDVTPATADTWILRRVRPILEGTLNGIYDFRFTPDFAAGTSSPNNCAALSPRMLRLASSLRNGSLVIELGASKSQCGQSEA